MEAEAPTKPASWHADVWFDGETYERLRDISEQNGCSIGEVIRQAVERATDVPAGASA